MKNETTLTRNGTGYSKTKIKDAPHRIAIFRSMTMIVSRFAFYYASTQY